MRALLNLFWVSILNLAALLSPAQAPVNSDHLFTRNPTPPGSADNVVTAVDHSNIRSAGERVVKRFMDLLNVISTGDDLELPELEKIIHDSYSQADTKIFYDSSSMIEDDLRAVEINKRAAEKTISRYLKDFDLLYRKSKDQSVLFSNFQVSNVKFSNYLYIKVFYDCLFRGRSVFSETPYELNKRVAELKVEKVNHKWKAWITDVHLVGAQDILTSTKNDVIIVYNYESRQVGRAEQTSDSTKGSLVNANPAYPGDRHSIETSGAVNQSQDIYNYYIKEALYAESLRKYGEALHNYQLALDRKPDDAVKLNFKIQQLTTRRKYLSEFDGMYMAGKYEEAIAGYSRAVRTDPECSDYYLGRGKCYERISDFRQALKDYNKAIDKDAYNSQVFKLRGSLHEIQGAFPEAIKDYTSLASMDKSNGYIYHKIAFLYVATGDLTAAVEALDKAISIDNHVASFYHLKGELLFKLRKPLDALANFSKAITLDSSKAVSFFHRGLARIDLNQINQAGMDFQAAKKRDTDHTYSGKIKQIGLEYYRAGMSRYEAGDLNSAVTQISFAILIDSESDEYYRKRADCYFKLNDFAKAIHCYADAIRLNPKNAEAYIQRGLSNFYISEYGQSIRDFEAAIRLNAKRPQTYKYLGDAYLKKQDLFKSISSYETALSFSRSVRTANADHFLAQLYTNLGEAYYHSGNTLKALQHYNEALKIDSKNGTIYFNRARTFLHFNELDHAEEDLRKALSYDNQNPLWNFTLGELLQKKGKYELAVAQYNTASALDREQSLIVDPVYKRAVCFMHLNQFANALRDFQTIRANHGENKYKGVNADIGSVLLRLNRPDSAVIFLGKAALNDSLNISVGYNLAHAYARTKKFDEALLWLRKTLALSSGQIKIASINQDFAVLKDDIRFKTLIKTHY